jgi:hypothetical protein
VRAFGGKKALIETQKRDELKRCYLNDNKIKILEIHYKEKNIEKLILDFIN